MQKILISNKDARDNGEGISGFIFQNSRGYFPRTLGEVVQEAHIALRA
jgi:hypothetical protein